MDKSSFSNLRIPLVISMFFGWFPIVFLRGVASAFSAEDVYHSPEISMTLRVIGLALGAGLGIIMGRYAFQELTNENLKVNQSSRFPLQGVRINKGLQVGGILAAYTVLPKKVLLSWFVLLLLMVVFCFIGVRWEIDSLYILGRMIGSLLIVNSVILPAYLLVKIERS